MNEFIEFVIFLPWAADVEVDLVEAPPLLAEGRGLCKGEWVGDVIINETTEMPSEIFRCGRIRVITHMHTALPTSTHKYK